MSTLGELSEYVYSIAQYADQNAQYLVQYKRNYLEKVAAQINSIIGGSASGADKEICGCFQKAISDIQTAIDCLEAASSAGVRWCENTVPELVRVRKR